VEITEVRIKLMDDIGDRLQAFCSITFDHSFVIRDLKIIEGTNGPFVAMPSRKLTARCPQCGCKNHLRAAYCNQCGTRLKEDRTIKDEHGRTKLYADIAHPINSRCREAIQDRIIQAFREEIDRSKQPGYISSYDELDEGEDFIWHDEPANYHPAPHARMASRKVAVENRESISEANPQRAGGPSGPHRSHTDQPACPDSKTPLMGQDFGAGIL
jgi:stage V sporulation protein G